MRLLDGARPEVHVGELRVLPVPREDLARLPGLEDEGEGLAVALAMLHGRDAVAEVHVHGAAQRQAGDEPAAADAVQHGVLLGHADGRVLGGRVAPICTTATGRSLVALASTAPMMLGLGMKP